VTRLEERHDRVVGGFEKRGARHLEPDHVESLGIVIVREPRTAPHDRAASICAYHEIGGQHRIAFASELHTDDSPRLRDEIGDRLSAQKTKIWERRTALDEHLEHLGLRDDARKQVVQIAPAFAREFAHEATVPVHANASRLGLGELVEVVFEAHLPERVSAAGHHGLAPKFSREILLALDQADIDSAPGEQVGERGTTGARPADHDALHASRLRPSGDCCTPATACNRRAEAQCSGILAIALSSRAFVLLVGGRSPHASEPFARAEPNSERRFTARRLRSCRIR